MQVVDGEPTFIETFKNGMGDHGFAKNVEIRRCPTAFSESYLAENAPDSELFYIDADPSSAAVVQDIAIASRITTHGLVCGDDWGWRNVRWGVLKSAEQLNVDMFVATDEIAGALGNHSNRTITDALVKRGWKKESRLAVLTFLVAHRLGQILRGARHQKALPPSCARTSGKSG